MIIWLLVESVSATSASFFSKNDSGIRLKAALAAEGFGFFVQPDRFNAIATITQPKNISTKTMTPVDRLSRSGAL